MLLLLLKLSESGFRGSETAWGRIDGLKPPGIQACGLKPPGVALSPNQFGMVSCGFRDFHYNSFDAESAK